MPYWYAATSDVPARITNVSSITSARRGSIQQQAILFRITDAAGVALTSVTPQVTVVSGGGAVAVPVSYDSYVPGIFGIDVRLGRVAGSNVFRVEAGSVSLDFTITGQ